MPRFIKIAGFILAVICSDVSSLSAHRGYTQTLLDQPVSIELKNEPLQDAFEKIASAAKVSFSYGNNAFLKEKVNLKAKDKRLGEVLDELLKPFPLTYTVIANKIIIRQDKNTRGRTAEDIIEWIKKGIYKVQPDKTVHTIHKEREAIDYALHNAKKGSFIVIISDVIPDALEQVRQHKAEEDAGGVAVL